jgi:hypothetical protein
MDLLGGGNAGVQGVLFFMIKQKKLETKWDTIIWEKNDDKRTVNNNYNSNTVDKQEFAVAKQVDGRAAHMTDTTRHQQG